MKEIDITVDDIKALYRVIDLVKSFSDKNPIRKRNINYDRLKKKLQPLINGDKRITQPDSRVFFSVLKKLKSIIKQEVIPEIFFICGGHGGIIIDDIGFCEFDAPKFALNRLIDRMKLALKTGMPFNIEIAISCLEWLKNQHPKGISEFLELYHKGRFEIINPSYSQPYNLIIGAESNIKQYEYGIEELKQLRLDYNNFYASECSLHPQIPQILKGFGIDCCSLRSRLLGMCPTTFSGNIDWIGLDGTKIQAMTDQSGIFNGEYWHGAFFQEIPVLLFQAVARPFMKYLLHSSIEDFVMQFPYQEDIWKVSKYMDLFGRFISCSEFFQLTKKNGEFKFNRDNFYLGEYIFVTKDLFLNSKTCEAILISAEIINCVLGLFDKESHDTFLDQSWKRYLLTQAHDNYAVPYIRNGDYSEVQLSEEELNNLEFRAEKISISELSVRIQRELQNKCQNFIFNGLMTIANHIGVNKNVKNTNIIIFNPSACYRKDIVSIPIHLENSSHLDLVDNNGEFVDFTYEKSILSFLAEVPSIGYSIYSFEEKKQESSTLNNSFYYKISISKEKKALEINFQEDKICELRFDSSNEYQLETFKIDRDSVKEVQEILGNMEGMSFKINITQYRDVNRLEFNLDAKSIDHVIANPEFKVSKTLVNYPFGIEETTRTQIQTLDFLWLKGFKKGLLYMQKNSQKFSIERDTFSIRNQIAGNGIFQFSLVVTNTDSLDIAQFHTNTYLYRLFGVEINDIDDFKEKTQSFLSIHGPLSVVNLWRRNKNSYMRVFNPNNEPVTVDINGPLVTDQLKEIDFNYNEERVLEDNKFEINPWKIKTIKL